MGFQGYCPVCSSEIPPSRIVDGVAICSCGWTDDSQKKKIEQARDKKTLKVFLGVAFTLCALYGYRLNWGSHAWSIPFIKAQQLTGTLSHEGYGKLAQICISLNEWDCAQESMLAQYRRFKDIEALARLGKLQGLLKLPEASAQTYGAYYQAGGSNPEVAFEYGRVLEMLGRVDEAIKYYQTSIDLRPQTLAVNATTNMVRLLIQNKRHAEAYDKLMEFHDTAENASGYLNAEFTECENELGDRVANQMRTAYERRTKIAKR